MITEKKILLISPASKVGGKATFTKLLLEEFKKNNIGYYHIDLVRARSTSKIIRFTEHLLNFFLYKLKVTWILLTKPIDIVQIHTSSYFDFYDHSIFILISKLFRKRIVVRYGGASFPSFYKNSTHYIKSYIKRILLSIDKMIVQSQYWNDYFTGLGVEKKNIFIFPNFVNTKEYSFQEIDKYDVSNLQILFMPGDALKRKGFYDLKDCLKELAISHPEIIFHIVGTKVSSYIGGKNIVTYKKILGQEKMNIFNKSQIYLLPTYAEGFPNSLLEAMATGMAVITTNIPQISCLADDGKNILLMEPGSLTDFKKLFNSLISDKNRIKRLGVNARKLVEEKYSQKLMPVYLKELYNG